MDDSLKGALEFGAALILMWIPVFAVIENWGIPMGILLAMPICSVILGLHACLRILKLFSWNQPREATEADSQ